jgi:predicted phage terminase large subunit-like protein
MFLSTSADVAIYGGAAGGGKSFSLLLEPLRHVGKRGFSAVIFRRTNPEITNAGGLWDESFHLYPALKAQANQTERKWYFPPHESSVHFSHMQHEKDRFNWQGSQIAMVGFDELTSFTEEQFFYMFSRGRSGSGVVPYIRATTNPDADSWVAELVAWWIDQDTGFPIPERAGVVRWFVRDESGDLLWADDPATLLDPSDPTMDPTSMTFIPAKVQDNKILLANNPKYLRSLKNLPAVERARLLNGNWKIRPAAGLVFDRAWFHLVAQPPDVGTVVAKVRYWDKAGTEGGTGSYSVGLLMSRTLEGRYYVEHVERGQWSSLDRNRVMKQTAILDGQDVSVWVEQEPGSGGKESAEASVRLLAGWDVRIERVTGDKITRARPVSAQAEAGNVRVVTGPWTKAYLDELHNFPAGAKDDQVDATSGAFNKLAAAVLVGPYDPEAEILDGIPEDEIGGLL